MSVGIKIKSLFWSEAAASAQRPVAPTPVARTATPAPAPAAPSPDLADITANVEQRLAALETGIASEQQRVRERREARAQAVQTATAKVQAEIKALEDRSAQLRKPLAAATAEVHTQDATDQQQLAAYVDRARAEAVRLAALRDFIARGGSQ